MNQDDLRKLKEDDSEALKECLRVVAQYGRRQGLSSTEADDLAAETVEAAWKSIGTATEYRGQSKPETWLIAIAKNLLASKWRRDARRPLEVADSEAAGAESRDIQDVETAAIGRMLVDDAMENLTDEERTAHRLRRIEGLSAEETARKMGGGKTPNAVGCLLYRAMRKLAKHKRDFGL